MTDLTARCRAANAVIEAISSTGRRFFWSDAYERRARFDIDHVGQAWYIDATTGLKLAPFHGRWTGFTGGIKAKALVFALAEFIDAGALVPRAHFPAEGWGYGSAMPGVIEAVMRTGAVSQQA